MAIVAEQQSSAGDRGRALAVAGAAAIAFSSTLVRLSKASPSTAAIFRCAYALPLLAFFAYRFATSPDGKKIVSAVASDSLPMPKKRGVPSRS